MTKARARLTSALFVFLMIASACGQKPGVHLVNGTSQFAGAGQGSDGAIAAGSETTKGGTTTDGGSSLDGGSSGGITAGSGSAAAADTRTGSSVGVSATQITIGFHAPITGASSVALSDIKLGTDLLRDYLKSKGISLYGRNVFTIVKDDQYNPQTAVSVCRELVETKKVFYLVGGAGADQIQACARYAASKGVPYLSAGVTENVLKSLPNYFAFSATYPDQTKPLVQLMKNFTQPASPGFGPSSGGPVMQDRCVTSPAPTCLNPTASGDQAKPEDENNTKVAMIYSDTDGFYDARDAFKANFQAAFGRPVDKILPITKFTLSGSDANSFMLNFKNEGIDVVFVLTAPTNWLELLNRANGQRYYPKWMGVGITMGINLVAGTLGCGRYPAAIGGSLFFSPWPSTRSPAANQYAEAFAKRYNRSEADARTTDLAFSVWGGSITQAALLYNAGKNLTRKSFIESAEKVQNFTWNSSMGMDLVKSFPTVSYSPKNHFGAHEVNLIWTHCDSSSAGQGGHWDYYPSVPAFTTTF